MRWAGRRAVTAWAAVAAAVGLGLAGCGGSGGNGGSGGGNRSGGGSGRSGAGGLSRTELAAKANAICARALASGLPTGGYIGDAATVRALYVRVAGIIDRQTRALTALRPATEAAKDWRAFTRAAAGVDRLAQRQRGVDVSTGSTGDPENLGVARRLVASATRVGATTCIEG